MGAIQVHNQEIPDIQGATQFPNGFRYLHEPIGDFGIWNGQFEQGLINDNPVEQPEGWEVTADASGEMTRSTGGCAGNWCYKGGQVGTGTGGKLLSLKYIPVYEEPQGGGRDYMLSAAFKGSSVNTTVSLGVACYNSNKTFLFNVTAITTWTPGISWVYRQTRVGPNGDVALPVGTRYIRVYILLSDTSLDANYAYVDDVQFQQMKMVYSPGIRLIADDIYREGPDTYTKASYTTMTGSQMTLALEEPGYIYFAYNCSTSNDSTRNYAALSRVSYDGLVTTNVYARIGSAAASVEGNVQAVGRTPALARGVHTVQWDIWVVGGTQTVRNLYGTCYYTRQY